MIALDKIKISIQIGICLSLLCIVSCTDQIDAPTAPAGKATLSLSLRPGMMITKSGTDENAVQALHVLVFERESTDSNFYIYKERTSFMDGGLDYEIPITQTENDLKIYLITNIPESDLGTPENQTSESYIRQLVVDFSGDESAIPMYGELELTGGIAENEGKRANDVQLLRAVASAGVENEATDRFSIRTLQVYRANDKIQIIPDAFNTDADGFKKVTTPSIPTEAIASQEYKIGDPGTEVISLGGLYFPESAKGTGSDPTDEVTCLIIGGVYLVNDPGNTTVTYYRVDFCDSEGNNMGQILRNHKYRVRIVNITREGYASPDLAAANPGKGMVADIGEIEEGDNGIIIGPDGTYMILGKSDLHINYFDGATLSTTLETNATNLEITWEDEQNWFEAEIAADKQSILFTALSENDGDSDRYKRAILSTGSVKLYLTVRQKPRSAHMTDHISIFSYNVAGYPHFGDSVFLSNDNPGGLTGIASTLVAMSNLIKNQEYFGHRNAIIPFEGFYFGGLIGQVPMTNRLADMFEMIFLHDQWDGIYWDDPEKVVPLYETLKAWQEADSRRVLMAAINCRYISTVFNIENLSGGWPIPFTGDYKIADGGDETFRTGPFGTVEAGGAVTATHGLINVIDLQQNPHLTPLLTMENNDNYAVLSVDKKNRVIYYGSANMFMTQSNTFSTDGTIRSDADILLANLFAWICEVVLGEKMAPDRD